MSLTLAHELLLLALKDEKGTVAIDDTALSFGLPGALLLELVLSERAVLEDKKLRIVDSTPHPDPFVQELMDWMQQDKKDERSLKDWVTRAQSKLKNLRRRMSDDLVERGILRHEEGRILWVFPTHRFPTGNPTPESEIRSRIRNVVLGGDRPDTRTAALIGLASGLALTNELFEKTDRKQAKARMKELASSSAMGKAVHSAIEEMTAAMVVIMAAVVTSTTVTSSGS